MEARIGDWVEYVHVDGTVLNARIEAVHPYQTVDLTVDPGETRCFRNGKRQTEEFTVRDVPFSPLRLTGTWHQPETPQNLQTPPKAAA